MDIAAEDLWDTLLPGSWNTHRDAPSGVPSQTPPFCVRSGLLAGPVLFPVSSLGLDSPTYASIPSASWERDLAQYREVMLLIAEGINFTSHPVRLANYLKPVISTEDHKRMVEVPLDCLANHSVHVTARASLLATKNLQRWLNEKKDLKLRCEKHERNLSSAREQFAFVETLAYHCFEIEVLKASVGKISSERDTYREDALHHYVESKALLQENVAQAELSEGLLS
ncbi:hypothetical protein HAX54_027686 [Datura stramonium]|uniref:Uncharacterized protein n=1 Tax=Datura stramonium TaxID=4076 RepID=A0ABS8S8Y2_DATST|nr:hypothetical protein [Datura stramonium]